MVGNGTTLQRSSELEQIEREDELILYSEPEAEGFVLNPSSRKIWELCDGARTLEEIVEELDRRHGLPAGTLRGDVVAAVRRLIDLGALREVAKGMLPWEELARPRADLADLEAVLSMFDERHPGVRARTHARFGGEPSIQGGAVALSRCYPGGCEDCDEAPLDHSNIARAVDYLERWPTGRDHFLRTMHACHPLIQRGVPLDEGGFLKGSICHASGAAERFGTMYSTINCPVMLAENFVHETGHMKLFALGILKEETLGLITNGPEHRYRSPVITDRPRPMTAVVHGVFAYMYVTEFDLHLIEEEPDPTMRELFRQRLGTNVDRIEQGLGEIRTHIRLDEAGKRFFAGFDAWIDELIERGKAVARGERRRARPAVPVAATDPVRVFVGSDPAQRRGEIALANSIRRCTRGPVEITWMDHGRGGTWAGWNIGRERGDVRQNPGPGWPTEFSGYRFAIPEAAGFRGRAIYLDVDMLALSDLRELFEHPMEQPWLVTPTCPAAMLIDCSAFAAAEWWPRLATMKESGWGVGEYMNLLQQRGVLGQIPAKWNCHDGLDYTPGETGIVHFTTRRTQPWRPHPKVFDYRPHPRPDLEELWWRAFLDGPGPADDGPTAGPSYDRAHPSPRYRELVRLNREMHVRTGDPSHGVPAERIFGGSSLLPHLDRIRGLISSHEVRTLLDYGAGKGLQYARTIGELRRTFQNLRAERTDAEDRTVSEYWGVDVACYDPAYPPCAILPAGRFGGVVCTDVLEHCPEEDLDWILAELFERAERFVFANVSVQPALKRLPNGENAHVTLRPQGWWVDRFTRASKSSSDKHFELLVGDLAVQGGKRPDRLSKANPLLLE